MPSLAPERFPGRNRRLCLRQEARATSSEHARTVPPLFSIQAPMERSSSTYDRRIATLALAEKSAYRSSPGQETERPEEPDQRAVPPTRTSATDASGQAMQAQRSPPARTRKSHGEQSNRARATRWRPRLVLRRKKKKRSMPLTVSSTKARVPWVTDDDASSFRPRARFRARHHGQVLLSQPVEYKDASLPRSPLPHSLCDYAARGRHQELAQADPRATQ